MARLHQTTSCPSPRSLVLPHLPADLGVDPTSTSGCMLDPQRQWTVMTRGRHRPTKAEPYRPAFSYRPPATYPLPLVETWEQARTRNRRHLMPDEDQRTTSTTPCGQTARRNCAVCGRRHDRTTGPRCVEMGIGYPER